ncbi:MAG: AAA domain-containing protein [Hellea sp.]
MEDAATPLAPDEAQTADALTPISLEAFLAQWRGRPSIGTEDILAAILPLMRQLEALHFDGKVGPVVTSEHIQVDHGHLFFPSDQVLEPRLNYKKVYTPPKSKSTAISIIEEVSVTSDDTTGIDVRDHDVRDADDAISKPRYLTHFQSWEDKLGHQDPVTDIFCVGMICAALATSLDFRDREQVETFARNRTQLHVLNNRLHPVLSRAIERMTNLTRDGRVQDISVLIKALNNHRQIGSAVELGIDNIAGFETDDKNDARSVLLKRLRARLYDMTRRNRLIYHRRVSGELNLTESSVPLVMNFDSIRKEDLVTASNPVFDRLIKGDEVKLGEYIRFEEMAFAPSVLAKIRSSAARDLREFGGSPLRLVPVFLRWYDLKNAPEEAISSPLLLMRVELKRRKGIKDAYTLKLLDTKAEINPALAFMLDSLYGIKLPNFVDLAEDTALKSLHQLLENQIMATEPGVNLSYSEKPKLRILHRTVRRRLDKFNKRRAHRQGFVRSRGSLRYQYERKNYNPLGVQMFREYVAIPEAPNRSLFAKPKVQRFNMAEIKTPTVTEKTVQEYQTINDTGSRFEWAFDLCSVTLANFNYRKMSLVRDYDAVLAGESDPETLFERFFTDKPRSEEVKLSPPERSDQFPIVASDPTQFKSIVKVRSGQSYVIQGPPGTGKSQTIANLLAEIISQDKRVLFVCEKRAALDVVYNRLRGVGIHQLCALVHDAQENKREFIKELEGIYTDWSEDKTLPSHAALTKDRLSEITKIEEALKDVSLLTDTVGSSVKGADDSLSAVLDLALSVPDHASHQSGAYLPDLQDWRRHETDVRRASAALRRLSGHENLAQAPERIITQSQWAAETVSDAIPELAKSALPLLQKLSEGTQYVERAEGALAKQEPVFGMLASQIKLAVRLLPAYEAGFEGVFQADSPQTRQYKSGLRELEDKQAKVGAAQELTKVWTRKLSSRDCQSALILARQKDGKLFSFLSKDWRNTKKLILSSLDSSSFAVKPQITLLLEDLKAEHDVVETLREGHAALARRFGYGELGELEALLTERDSLSPAEGEGALPLWAAVKSSPENLRETITQLAKLKAVLEEVETRFADKFDGYHALEMPALISAVQSLAESSPQLRELQPVFAPLSNSAPKFWQALRVTPFAPDAMGDAVLVDTVKRTLNAAPGLLNVDGAALMDIRARLRAHQNRLYDLNAKLLVRRAIDKFTKQAGMRNIPDRNLSMPDRALKSAINKGLRALEHEFGKTRAYRSPREMLSGPAGAVLPTLKPIWLMSPLSVADVLPLAPDLFDVVIFDEASQIPVEDAIPTVLRAPQVIVVGDEKQLPPTNFFNSSSGDEDFDTELGDDLDFELDQESFLSLAAERLPATMLGWHYRSRSEELIGFSNEAFYTGKLLTIPSVRKAAARAELAVGDPAILPAPITDILARPISFNYLPGGIYSDRRNKNEAEYIAQLTREILMDPQHDNTGKTIGIVAFSEAQQNEIETALKALASQDSAFATKFDMEQDREEDGEFIGLFVKNLENVQGDERDIIILSICYGHDVTGKMRMNFGPINKGGGEKRLNVIFSRAKENVIVVSSIKSPMITNDYNFGANTLKTYLKYAESLSVGNLDAARSALRTISSGQSASREARQLDVRTRLAKAFEAKGWDVEESVGLSSFTIDLALKGKTDKDYKTAILLDTVLRYDQGDVEETFTARANILEAFGWNVICIPLTQWWQNPESVIALVGSP